MWTKGTWETQVMRETRRHLSSFTPVYLTDTITLRGNRGAYFKGRIWLAEELKGRRDVEVEEILHHEIFHGKIARARLLGVPLGGMSMDVAMKHAGQVASDALANTARADLIEHYRLNASPDYDEECMVQLCLAVRFRNMIDVPDPLLTVCEALVEPFCHRPVFLGGFLGTLPHAFQCNQVRCSALPLPSGNLPPAPKS